jgi:hypothetical protein
MSRVFEVWKKPADDAALEAAAPNGADDAEVERAVGLIAEGLMAAVRLLRRRDAAEVAELGSSVRLLRQASEATIGGVLELRDRVDRLIVTVEQQHAAQQAAIERQEHQQAEVAGMRHAVADLSDRVNVLAGRLDRQAEAFRAMYEVQGEREAAFHEMGEALLKLRQASPPAQNLSQPTL